MRKTIALLFLLAPALALAEAPPSPPGAAPASDTAAPEGGGGGLDLKPEFGPKDVKLGHELSLKLPEGYMYFDAPQAKKLAASMGNVPDDSLLAILIKVNTTPEGQKPEDWFVEVSYFEEGYVKDDEKLDEKAILDSIREGTEEANKVRAERGFKPIHVDGWAEAPRYEKQSHHLVWAVKGSDADSAIVNFNTRILGRRGVASLNLIGSPEQLPAAKPQIAALLAVTSFEQGGRYEDFQPKTDKVAEFGLAALVAGGAGAVALKLVKVGLLAKFGAVILKFLAVGWKFILLAFVALGGFLKRLVGIKPKEQPAEPPVAVTQTPPTDPPTSV